MFWFLNKHRFIFEPLVHVFAQIAGMVLSLVFNSYFLGVLILTKELRQLSYVPLILQALSDLISMGILGLLVGVSLVFNLLRKVEEHEQRVQWH